MLAAEFTKKDKNDFNIKLEAIYLWANSQKWINTTASSLLTFVAHRVAQIQEMTDPELRRNVASKDNPADLSRGCIAAQLRDSSGAPFLAQIVESWPKFQSIGTTTKDQ